MWSQPIKLLHISWLLMVINPAVIECCFYANVSGDYVSLKAVCRQRHHNKPHQIIAVHFKQYTSLILVCSGYRYPHDFWTQLLFAVRCMHKSLDRFLTLTLLICANTLEVQVFLAPAHNIQGPV